MKYHVYHKLVIIIIYMLPLGYVAFSQNQYSINGVITNDQDEKVEVGNIMILSNADSSFILGDVFYDGVFSLDHIKETFAIIKISALGYETYYDVLSNENGILKVDLGQIILKSTWLESIEVRARQDVVQMRGNDIIVNVAQTALSDAGTAQDLLKNVPKVIVGRGGQISVIGKGVALIYLDGLQISSTQILANISSKDIKQIEVIENPSAKYDASGNAVINIVTKTHTLEGYKVNLLQEIGKGKYFRSYFQGGGYYKIKNLMLQANYGIKPWTWGGKNFQGRQLLNDPNAANVENHFTQKNSRLDHDFSFKMNYKMGTSSKMGLSYSGSAINGEKDALSSRNFSADENSSFNIESNVLGPYDQQSNTLNGFYHLDLDTLGTQFQITAQLASFKFDQSDNIEQQFIKQNQVSDLNRRSKNLNDISIFTVQADYTHGFQSGLKWESGIKNAFVTNNSEILFESKSADQFNVLSDFSNQYFYDENILAAYSQVNWSGGNFTLTAGLRGEWTQTDGASNKETQESLFSKTYFDLFPSASLSKSLNQNTNASLSYSYRINRPLFRDLNPYVLYVDSLVSLRGNPNLKPEYSHSLSSNITFKKVNIGIAYTFTKNKVNQIFRSLDSANPDVISFVKENLQRTSLYSAFIAFPITYKWYSAYFNIGGFYDDHRTVDSDQSLAINSRPGFNLQINQSFNLPLDIKLDTYINYTSSRVDGVYLDNPISFVNVSLSRKFFNDHLNLRFWANDVFDKYRFIGISNFNNMSMNYLSEGDWHFFKIALNWNFGKFAIGSFKENKVSREELNRVN